MEVLDWMLFSLLMVVSLGIGVFFRCFNKNMDKNDFLMASRNMSPFTGKLDYFYRPFSDFGFILLLKVQFSIRFP